MNAFRDFDVDAYNARLARMAGAPTQQSLLPRDTLQLPKLLESTVLSAVLQVLGKHPKVGGFWRQNTGAHEVDGRRIRYGIPGCPDVIGWLKDGRFMAIEVKRPGGELTPAQAAFLAKAEKDGCFTLVAKSVDDVMAALA
jgi:hypothetical protein